MDFQAKFCTAQGETLGNKIIGEIKAKLKNLPNNPKYTEVKKIYYFLNKPFGESSKKDQLKPDNLLEIEKLAVTAGVTLEIMDPARISQTIRDDKYSLLSDLFFNPEPGLDSYLKYLDHKTFDTGQIQQHLPLWHGDAVQIDHNTEPPLSRELLTASPSRVILISGDPGTGKSTLLHSLLPSKPQPRREQLCLVGTDFDHQSHIDMLVDGAYHLYDYLDFTDGISVKLCVIDSAEKILYLEQGQECFQSFTNDLIKRGWTLVCTVRSSARNDLVALLAAQLSPDHITDYRLPYLPLTTLQDLSREKKFSLPSTATWQDLVRRPFYLKLYLQILSESANFDFNREDAEQQIWEQICLHRTQRGSRLPARREQVLLDITQGMLEDGTYSWVPDLTKDAYDNALSALVVDGVLNDLPIEGAYAFSHDLFEDLAVSRLFTKSFNSPDNTLTLARKLGKSHRFNTALRSFLSEKIEQDQDTALSFFIELLSSDAEDRLRQDLVEILFTSRSPAAADILQALIDPAPANPVLTDTQISDIFSMALQILGRDEAFTIELSYRLPPLLPKLERLFERFGPDEPVRSLEIILEVLYKKPDVLDGATAELIRQTALALRWQCFYFPQGRTADLCTHAALRLLEQPDIHPAVQQILCEAVLCAGPCVFAQLRQIWEKHYDSIITASLLPENWYDRLFITLAQDCLFTRDLAQFHPKFLIWVLRKLWMVKCEPIDSSDNVERTYLKYGLNPCAGHTLPFLSSSALKTPLLSLLHYALDATINFIVELTDYAVCQALTSPFTEKDEISTRSLHLPNGKIIKQQCSKELWLAHRGVISHPGVLCSALQALEQYLLYRAEQDPGSTTGLMLHLLEKSRSCSITAVVTSVVLAHPQYFDELGLALLSHSWVFLLDLFRSDRELNFRTHFQRLPNPVMINLTGIDWNTLHLAYKEDSDALSFRRCTLCSLALSTWSEGDYRDRCHAALQTLASDQSKIVLQFLNPLLQKALAPDNSVEVRESIHHAIKQTFAACLEQDGLESELAHQFRAAESSDYDRDFLVWLKALHADDSTPPAATLKPDLILEQSNLLLIDGNFDSIKVTGEPTRWQMEKMKYLALSLHGLQQTGSRNEVPGITSDMQSLLLEALTFLSTSSKLPFNAYDLPAAPRLLCLVLIKELQLHRGDYKHLLSGSVDFPGGSASFRTSPFYGFRPLSLRRNIQYQDSHTLVS